MLGYRTEIAAFLFTAVICFLIYTDKLDTTIGLGLLTSQLAPLFAGRRASRNTKALQDSGVIS